MEALNDLNETFRLFGQLEKPSEKEREARICSCYKLALRLLVAKSHESNPAKVAMWCRFLAQLVMQPKHRIICVRMAIKANLDVRNYGVAHRFISVLLPLNLMDKSTQESQDAICKENNFQDFAALPYTCPGCGKNTPSTEDKCQDCGRNILLCNQTLELITTPTYCQCEYCLAILSGALIGNKCSICLSGNLIEKTGIQK